MLNMYGGVVEQKADAYAENKLIDLYLYHDYAHRSNGHFTVASIMAFAKSINRDPGIVLGKLENDRYLDLDHDYGMRFLRGRYHVSLA